jgi:hypothetical protein
VRDLVDAAEVDQVELEGVSRPVKIYEVRQKDGGPIGEAGPSTAVSVG